jgi:hypothetical protein
MCQSRPVLLNKKNHPSHGGFFLTHRFGAALIAANHINLPPGEYGRSSQSDLNLQVARLSVTR